MVGDEGLRGGEEMGAAEQIIGPSSPRMSGPHQPEGGFSDLLRGAGVIDPRRDTQPIGNPGHPAGVDADPPGTPSTRFKPPGG